MEGDDDVHEMDNGDNFDNDNNNSDSNSDSDDEDAYGKSLLKNNNASHKDNVFSTTNIAMLDEFEDFCTEIKQSIKHNNLSAFDRRILRTFFEHEKDTIQGSIMDNMREYVGEREKRASRENENEERIDGYCNASSLRSSSLAQRAVIVLTSNSLHQQQQVQHGVPSNQRSRH